jgi:1-deoxy-D-xylulose-5-phosphate reductoisomerase
MKKIALLGSTGSIGKSTLRIIEHLKDTFEVYALAAHSNIELLAQQIESFKPRLVCVYSEEKGIELQKRFPYLRVVFGENGLEEIVTHASVDYIVMAIVGMRALKPTIQAIQAKKNIGLASKEVLVAAGEYVSSLAKKMQVRLMPIDSEHSALFQCLEGRNINEVSRIILTASGGPFHCYGMDQLENVTVEDALAHPTWNMGPKVTIDSSTLINKGLEMVEARWLFDLPPEKIEVVIHPQSIVHSFVEFIDGTSLAQINEPSMTYPIQYALTYPHRKKSLFPQYNFAKNHTLTFSSPDTEKFPGLKLAQECLKKGGSSPTFLNAANEILVERFLKKEIAWKQIAILLERLLGRHCVKPLKSLDEIFSVDREAREEARVA